jgi:hypothetical protein
MTHGPKDNILGMVEKNPGRFEAGLHNHGYECFGKKALHCYKMEETLCTVFSLDAFQRN